MTTFLRLLESDDKAADIAQAVDAVRSGRAPTNSVFAIEPDTFRQVPGSPFAYWVSKKIRGLFHELESFEGNGRKAQHGLSTKDDAQFVRTSWEVPPELVVAGDKQTSVADYQQQTFSQKRWVPFAKGGSYSPYYSDIHLVVNWEKNGYYLEQYLLRKYPYLGESANWILHRECHYFRAGLTWPIKNKFTFKPWPLPSGCIFAHVGASAFFDNHPIAVFQALMSSSVFSYLLKLTAGWNYEVGVIQRIPIPAISIAAQEELSQRALACVNLKRDLDTANDTSHVFSLPALLQTTGGTLTQRILSWQSKVHNVNSQLAENQRVIDDSAFRLYNIEGKDRQTIEESLSDGRQAQAMGDGNKADQEADEELGEEVSSIEPRRGTADLLSWAVGSAFGRWDVRLATGERPVPELSDPFSSLPVCSPGMLTGGDGLPSRHAPPGYPLTVDWDGILVDDPEHPDDIIGRVRDVLDLLWGDHAEAIVYEACDILGIKELRDYFRDPKRFWDDHIKRYSKSRRKAPMYWLLQSPRKHYSIWLYYHRLDSDILFKALNNYVERKINREENRLSEIQAQRQLAGSNGKDAKRLERDIDRQEALLFDIHEFRDRLERAAKLNLTPDLNDGVILNIAPLWELVPWKEPKAYWEDLCAGKYEWSSIGKQLREAGLVK